VTGDGDITSHPVGVNVSAIEKELAALWRQASADKQVTRACSWNLVVLTPDEATYAITKPVLDDVVRDVPSRALVLKPRAFSSGGPAREIEAWVSANCQVAPGGGKLLCTEEITVEARGAEGHAHLAGLIRALNVPDVPTALWWAGAPPTDASAVRLLAAGVDRLIYDAGSFSAEEAADDGLKKLAHLGGLLDDVAVVDLAWLRTSSLRSALARVFDREGAAPLYALSRVRLRCAPHSAATAKLFVGWLASRLGWGAPERTERHALAWRAPTRDGDVRIDVDATEPATTRGSGLSLIELVTRGHERFALSADVGERVVVDTPRISARAVTAHDPRAAEVVVAALGTRGRDRLYPIALHRAVELDR
jgi:glucose-6-phosphate dehydrogenase assembly protein OpcA